MLQHPFAGQVEVLHTQEQTHPAGVLPADRTRLSITIRSSEQEPRLRSGGPDDDPPLRPAVVRVRGCVLDQLEPSTSTKNEMARS